MNNTRIPIVPLENSLVPIPSRSFSISINDSHHMEIYYVVDLDTQVYDTYSITKCLHVFLQTTFRDRLLVRFQHVPLLPNADTTDVIKRGLQHFCYMYETLKLKSSSCEVWFIYISNGNICPPDRPQPVLNDVGIMLVNKNPEYKECAYTIHKTPFKVLKNESREQRLNDLKTFTKTFKELFQSNKTLKYSAIHNPS